MLTLMLPLSVKPVELWDSTLLRFYAVAKNDRIKTEVIDSATPCFCGNLFWPSKPIRTSVLALQRESCAIIPARIRVNS